MFKIPIVPADQAPQKAVRFWARVASFGLQPTGQSETAIHIATDNQDLFLDSGTTLTTVPEPVYAAVKTMLGGEELKEGGVVVNCSLFDNPPDGGLVFHFAGGGSIVMGYDDLIIDIRPLVPPGTPACYLGIDPIGQGSLPILGRKF